MKKALGLLVVFVFSAGLLLISDGVVFARQKDKEKEKPKAEEIAQPQPQQPQQEAKLIYTFKNDEQLKEFEQLYIAKQATFGRMGVLQAYFAMEQNNLTEIDKQMDQKFGFRMDLNKMYDLNRETKEIREVGTVPQAPAPAE